MDTIEEEKNKKANQIKRHIHQLVSSNLSQEKSNFLFNAEANEPYFKEFKYGEQLNII